MRYSAMRNLAMQLAFVLISFSGCVRVKYYAFAICDGTHVLQLPEAPQDGSVFGCGAGECGVLILPRMNATLRYECMGMSDGIHEEFIEDAMSQLRKRHTDIRVSRSSMRSDVTPVAIEYYYRNSLTKGVVLRIISHGYVIAVEYSRECQKMRDLQNELRNIIWGCC